MARIAAIITDWFEDAEYTTPADKFREAGHEVVTVGDRPGETVEGKRGEARVRVEKDVKKVSPDDFDALLIPGGFSPDNLRVDENAVQFVKGFMDREKPVFSICHGAQLLITADVLEGRKVTGWKSIIQDLINAGAEYEDREVVVDGNLVSSRHPGDLPAFVRESLQLMG
ncbi:MAG: type 1 glutamine amidotransferase domain-containing protein [Desulfatibacillaceae bacterium]